MAIGLKVDPSIIVAGNVIALQERLAFVSEEDRVAGKVGDIERYDALLSQGDGGQVVVRYRLRDKLELPRVGEYLAVEARVSEGTFNDDQGRPRQFVSLYAVAPAYNALDMILSTLNNGQAKKAA